MKIGIDIGGSHIGVGVVNDNGIIVEQFETRILNENKTNIKEFLENYIIKKINFLVLKYEIDFIGISSAGKIRDGVIKISPNLGIKDYKIIQSLKDKSQINIDIRIKNDAKCAALAEKEYGSLKKSKNALFLGLGTGIGGALIKNSELVEKEEIFDSEFGHMILEPNGIRCNCGKNGCFERYASIKTLKNKLRENLKLNEETTGEELINIIKERKNDPLIEKILDEYIDYLVLGLSKLIDIFTPDIICIGGSFAYYRDILLERFKYKLYQNKKYKDIKVVIAVLGNDAGIIGATLI